MPFTKTNGISTYYEIHGGDSGGDTILLLHHGFGCTKMWKNIFAGLVEKGYRVIMYDRRGYGQSEKGPGFKEFYESERFRPESVRELARLREILHFDSFHIIGQCEGGVVGIDYAIKYPQQVKTVSISSTQCYSETTMAEFNSRAFPKPFQDLDPELKDKMTDWHGDEAESSYNQFRTYGGAYGKDFFDLRNLLPSVTCPTLVLYPDRSFLFDVEQAVSFYRHLQKGELSVLPNCGHNTYEQKPEEYLRIVLNFLDRHKT